MEKHLVYTRVGHSTFGVFERVRSGGEVNSEGMEGGGKEEARGRRYERLDVALLSGLFFFCRTNERRLDRTLVVDRSA